MQISQFKNLCLGLFLLLTGCQSSDWTISAPRDNPVPVNAIVLSPDQSRAVIVGGRFYGLLQQPTPGFAFIIDLDSGLMQLQLPNQGDGVSSAVFMDDGQRIITGSYDTSLLLADLIGDHRTTKAWLANVIGFVSML